MTAAIPYGWTHPVAIHSTTTSTTHPTTRTKSESIDECVGAAVSSEPLRSISEQKLILAHPDSEETTLSRCSTIPYRIQHGNVAFYSFPAGAVYNEILSILFKRLYKPQRDVLNWDVPMEAAPPRPSGFIDVTFDYVGRTAPLPVEDPWD